MSALYPGAARTFTSKATNDTIQAAHVNDLQDEVTAVETALLGTLLHDIKLTTAKKFYEQARTKAIGEAIAVAFAGGDYSAAGGGSLTIGSGDVVTNEYALIADTLLWNFFANSLDITGVVTGINIKIPGGLTPQLSSRTIDVYLVDGANVLSGAMVVTASATSIQVARPDAAGLTIGTNTVAIGFRTAILKVA